MTEFKKPILFVTLGYPGSGKTFFSRRFAKDFECFHLNSDRLRLEIFPKPNYILSEHTTVFRVMDFLAGELLQRGISVIYDANVTKRIHRKRLLKIATKNQADFLLLWFKTPVKVALKRNKKRGSEAVDDSVLFRIKAEEEVPDKEPHVVLEPTSYQKQKDSVINFLKNKKESRLRS